MDWRLLVEERIANIGITIQVFVFLCFEIFQVFGLLQTSLLCIIRELVGGRYVAVAVGVSDM